MFTAALPEDEFGAVGQAVHQHQAAQGDEKIALAALAQLQLAIAGGDAVDGAPRFGQGCLESAVKLVVGQERSLCHNEKGASENSLAPRFQLEPPAGIEPATY